MTQYYWVVMWFQVVWDEVGLDDRIGSVIELRDALQDQLTENQLQHVIDQHCNNN